MKYILSDNAMVGCAGYTLLGFGLGFFFFGGWISAVVCAAIGAGLFLTELYDGRG